STGIVVSNGDGTYRVDAPSHSYVEEGTYTVTVTVQHDALAALTTAGQTIVVADEQITTPVAANLPATGLEGAALPVILGIATFTDPAGVGNETTADFAATIDWGDGSTSTGSIASLGGGNYRVDAPAHTYVEEGTYTVGVSVTHDLLTAVASNTQTIVVADQQLADLTSSNLPASGLEGQALAAIASIATFVDPAGTESDGIAAYTAVINWGDGSTDTGVIVDDGGGQFHVSAPAHAYIEEGTFAVNVTLTHDALAAVTTPNQTIVVADQQLTNLASAGLPAAGLEGTAIGAITGIATFTDPAGVGNETTADFAATVNWGDGTTDIGTVNSNQDGTYSVDAPDHTYVEEGTYTVTVTLTHDLLAAVTTPAQTIVVADQQITGLTDANLPANGLEGAAVGAVTGIATFTDPAGVGKETPADFAA